MPEAGLQCWDENGELVADLTDRIGKVIASGTVTFSGLANRQFVAVPGLENSDRFYVNCTGYVVTRITAGLITLDRYNYVTPNETQYYSVVQQ